MKLYAEPVIPDALLAFGGVVMLGLAGAFVGWMLSGILVDLRERWRRPT